MARTSSLALNAVASSIPLNQKRNRYNFHLLSTPSEKFCIVVDTPSKQASTRVRQAAYNYGSTHGFKVATRDDGPRLRVYRVS